ncbi:hypothetical protein [Streptomyces sp. NPDC051132]|uniref:hypothetical protein n=1 Tax=unclassified Streptomyces TaxID=2593676 RepID=UPI00342B9344
MPSGRTRPRELAGATFRALPDAIGDPEGIAAAAAVPQFVFGVGGHACPGLAAHSSTTR